MPKKLTIWIFIGLVLIILAYTLFIQKKKVPENINNQAAAVLSEAEKATLLAQLNAQVATYQKAIDDLKAQLEDVKSSALAACVPPLTVITTLVCPTGQTGSITETRTKGPAPACTLSAPTVVNTCTTVNTRPPSAAHPHEPTGMEVLTDRDFNSSCDASRTCEGWNQNVPPREQGYKIVQDGTAPYSKPNVAQIDFNNGLAGTSPVATGDASLWSNRKKVIYLSTWMKLSSNWTGNPSGTNKLFHFNLYGNSKTTGRTNELVLYARGSASNPNNMVAMFLTQGLPAEYCMTEAVPLPPAKDLCGPTGVNHFPNINKGDEDLIKKGQWQHYEALVDAGTPGGVNGSIQWWLDGVELGHYTHIPFVDSESEGLWNGVNLDPTWGGGGGFIPETFQLFVDNVFISGK